MVPIIADFTAEKEDEISVSKGESVQILAANQHQMYLVYKSASEETPAAEGWIPGHVIATRTGTPVDSVGAGHLK